MAWDGMGWGAGVVIFGLKRPYRVAVVTLH